MLEHMYIMSISARQTPVQEQVGVDRKISVKDKWASLDRPQLPHTTNNQVRRVLQLAAYWQAFLDKPCTLD